MDRRGARSGSRPATTRRGPSVTIRSEHREERDKGRRDWERDQGKEEEPNRFTLHGSRSTGTHGLIIPSRADGRCVSPPRSSRLSAGRIPHNTPPPHTPPPRERSRSPPVLTPRVSQPAAAAYSDIARLEQKMNSMHTSMQAAMAALEGQVGALGRAIEHKPSSDRHLVVASSDSSDQLQALKEELLREQDSLQLSGPHTHTCRSIKAALHHNTAKQLASWADSWEKRGNVWLSEAAADMGEKVRGEMMRDMGEAKQVLQQLSQLPFRVDGIEALYGRQLGDVEAKISGAHLKLAETERRVAQQTQDLAAAVDGMKAQLSSNEARLAMVEADTLSKASYQEEIWQHLKETSQAMEAAVKDLAEDTSQQIAQLRDDIAEANRRDAEIDQLLGDAACLVDVQGMNARLTRTENEQHRLVHGADGQQSQLREEMRRLQDRLQAALSDTETRLQRQLAQDTQRRRQVEDRIAELELEARSERVLPVVETLRVEMADTEGSYRRRLDAQDRQIAQLRRQLDDSNVNDGIRRQLQNVQEVAEEALALCTDKVAHGSVSALEEELLDLKRRLGLETDSMHRRINTRAEREKLKQLTRAHEGAVDRIDALETQTTEASPRQYPQETAAIRRQLSKNTMSLNNLSEELEELRQQVREDSERVDEKLDSASLPKMLSDVVTRAVDAVRSKLTNKLESRISALEGGSGGSLEADSLAAELEALQMKLQAVANTVEKMQKSTPSEVKKEFDKYNTMLGGISSELDAMKDSFTESENRAAELATQFEGLQRIFDNVIPRDLKATLQKQRDEFERMKKEVENIINAAEQRHQYFQEEFNRMSGLLNANFEDDEKRANEMREIQEQVGSEVTRALTEMQALSTTCDEQIYEMGRETSSWRDRVAAAERKAAELKGYIEKVSKDRDLPIALLNERVLKLEHQVTVDSQKVRRQLEIANAQTVGSATLETKEEESGS